jgi:hypothetical protein
MTTKKTTPLLIALMILSVTLVAVWAQDDVAPVSVPKSELPKVSNPIAFSMLREALLACGTTLKELDAQFETVKLAPSTWQPAVSAMREQWDGYMGRAQEAMLKNLPANIAGDLVKNQLQPWASEYRRFIKTVIITPSNVAVAWKYTIDQRTSTWRGLPKNMKSIMGALKEEADAIFYEYEELKAYADSVGEIGLAEMPEHNRMKARARALVTRTANLGRMLSDKQKNLIRIFKEESPANYETVLNQKLVTVWDMLGEFSEYPNVLQGWKDIVAGWFEICYDRFDEYTKQYEIAKKSCEPITKTTIFNDYPPLKGLYFSNLDKNMIALMKLINGM